MTEGLITALENLHFWSILVDTLCCNSVQLELETRSWHPDFHNKAAWDRTFLNVRPSAHSKTPSHRSARTWDPTHLNGVRCVVVESQYIHRHCVPKVTSRFKVDSKIEGRQPAAELGQQPAAKPGQKPTTKGGRSTRKSSGSIQPPGAAERGAAASRQIEWQQPVARSSGSSQSPGAADREAAASRQGRQTEGSRSRGSSQPPGAADRGAIPQTTVTRIFSQ